jgi:hypothetical protein
MPRPAGPRRLNGGAYLARMLEPLADGSGSHVADSDDCCPRLALMQSPGVALPPSARHMAWRDFSGMPRLQHTSRRLLIDD